MLDPNYIAVIADGAEEVSEELHDAIINMIVERITARIGNGDDYILTATDKWQIEVLEDAGYLLKDIQKEIAKKTKLADKEIRKAFKDAGVKTDQYDAEVYQKTDISMNPISQSPNILRLFEAEYERSLYSWKNFTGTTLAREAYKQFINECDKAYNLVSSGAQGWTQAYMNAVDNIATNGVQVTYPTGHVDTIETATVRAIRTGVSQACGKVTAVRAAENGVHLMLTSAHAGARPNHEEWQGNVFWVDWEELNRRIDLGAVSGDFPEATEEEKAKYPEFCKTTDIGTVTGLEGANCRHSYGPFFAWMKNPYENMTFDKDMYEKEQRARLLERRVRATKRQLSAYETALKNNQRKEARKAIEDTIKRKKALLERQVKAYYDYCDANDLKRQEARLHIGS